MPVATYVGTGSVGSGTTSAAAGLPTGWAAGDLFLLFVAWKNSATDATTPDGWTPTPTPVGAAEKFTGGTGTVGNDTGTMGARSYYRIASAGDADPSVSVPSANVMQAWVIAHRPTTDYTFDDGAIVATGGGDTSGGTAYSATGAHALGFQLDDSYVFTISINTDAPTSSGVGGNSGGAGGGGMQYVGNTPSDSSTITGGDMRSLGRTNYCINSTANTTPTATATFSTGSPSGVSLFVRAAQVLAPTGVTGTAESTLPPFTQTAAATYTPEPITGSGSSPLPNFTQASVGNATPPEFTGTAASILPGFTQAADGAVTLPVYTGTAASPLPGFGQSAVGDVAPPVPATPTGVTLDPTDTTIVASWTASPAATSYTVEWEIVTSDVTGAAASTLPGFTQSAAGTYAPPTIAGTVTSSLPGFTQAAAGDTTVPVFTGTATSSLPGISQTAAGTYTPEPITGAAASTLPTFTQAASGSGVAPQFTGTAASQLPAFGQAATGTTTVPVYESAVTSELPGFTQQATGTAAVPEFAGVIESTLPTFTQAAEGAAFVYTVLPDDARATTRTAHRPTVTTRVVSSATVTTSSVGPAHVVTATASGATTTTRTVSDANTVSRVASDAHTTTSPATRATATTRENAWQST